MRAVIQRVSSAAVRVDGELIGEIGPGLLILLGVGREDGPGEADVLAARCAQLRIFSDDEGKMNRSLLEVGGAALVVSQFTLWGDTRRGRRPSFVQAAPPEQAIPLYERFVAALRGLGAEVETGRFQALMAVSLVNDGPVTFVLDTDQKKPGA